jgi:RimJ/RimL family protein N-acetyltransferase
MRRKSTIAGNLVRIGTAAWEVWDEEDMVGIMFLTDIVDRQDAQAHFAFWDKGLHGKSTIINRVLQGHVFDGLGLHRVTVQIPAFMYKLGSFIERRLGFELEGTKREALLANGKWNDILIYGCLNGRRHTDNDQPV